MVASSHLTANDAAFRHLAEVQPAAVTLKTASLRHGGEGKPGGETNVESRRKVDFDGPGGLLAGSYTDGPKPLELWNLESTILGTRQARSRLGKDCAIGLSVLDKQDYVALADGLPLDEYQYIELNWKYALRDASYVELPAMLHGAAHDLERFVQAFPKKPLFVKLPREAAPLLATPEMSDLLWLLDANRIGLIVANSRRAPVPLSRSRQSGKPDLLDTGVLVGDLLFFETYDLFRRLRRQNRLPALVATGGVMDIGSVMDLASTGAVAFQIASAIDAYGTYVLTLLRQQLESALNTLRVDTWTKACEALTAGTDPYREVIVSVRKMMRMPDNVGTALNASELDPVVIETLNLELGEDLPDGWTKEPSAKPPLDDITFIALPGNVSSSLLSRRVAADLGLREVEQRSSSKFVDAVVNGTLTYDFAILHRGAVTQLLEKLGADSQMRPLELGPVGLSCTELVGSAKAPEDFKVIYHFPGSSFRPLIQKTRKAAPDAELVSLDPSKLLVPMLSAWSNDKGIIAKAPLSRIYGRLTPEAVRNGWTVLLTDCESLLLVASKAMTDRAHAEHAIQAVCFGLHGERLKAIRNPEAAARTLRAFGLATYLLELLAYKGQNTRVSGLA